MGEPSTLVSTTEDIIRQCPRFRILVVGKSGVGKSSLINRAFNVDIANISHRERGRADINVEITSSDNPRFVLHDSQGFEPGEFDNLKIVQDFIQKRSQQPNLEDKLHAIWLCVEIPRAGGRAFETGDEMFLKDNLQAGDVPIIVVFTKYDMLVTMKRRDMRKAQTGPPDEEQIVLHANAAVQQSCVEPLTRINPRMPHAKVSARNQYENMLSELIQITHDLVFRHVEGDVWLVWAIAQRANIQVNIEDSITVGMKKYWRGLASSVHFPGNTLRQCLDVILRDIVAVWHFRDSEELLLGDNFKNMIWSLVEDLGPDAPASNPGVSQNIGTIQSTVAIATALSAPLASVTAAVGVAFTAGGWLYRGYEKTPSTLRCLMGYIVDLTIVMERLFWISLKTQRTSSLSMEEIEEAFDAHKNSVDQKRVHREIREYVEKSSFAHHVNSNNAHEEVIRLIRSNRFDASKNES